MDFGESVSPTAAISAILGTYPFSIGLLREILQNSDDAGASKQIFLLDRRTHGGHGLLDERLASSQGPALLAYNNATFRDDDWLALQRIHQSSKKTDTSKIGKYGIGFRSCYHITDNPQILSGQSLAILDPHQNIFPSGGKRADILQVADHFPGHISALNIGLFHPGYTPTMSLEASIIRLPFRQDGSQSEISKKVLTCDEVKQLLTDFIDEEIDIAMLFLSHIEVIEVMEVDDTGVRHIGTAEIQRQHASTPNSNREIAHEVCSVSVHLGHRLSVCSDHSQSWEILRMVSSVERVASLLSDRLGYNVNSHLEREKLSPSIALALPMPLLRGSQGKLFTFLPLPLPTGFPLHIHSLFALTQARQNLWNGSERGLVKGTRDELLVEWNKVLFDTYIPEAWAELLLLLSQGGLGPSQPEHIFFAWPPQSHNTPGGDPAYWQPLAECLLRVVIDKQLSIWPVLKGPYTPSFAPIQDCLIATCQDPQYLPALASAGVQISQPPEYILDMISNGHETFKELTPHTAHTALLDDARYKLTISLPTSDKFSILSYLLSTQELSALAGIPVVPTSNGEFVALVSITQSQAPHVLLRAVEIEVFASCDEHAILLGTLPEPTQSWFYDSAPGTLNLIRLNCSHVADYLSKVLERHGVKSGQLAPEGLVEWLHMFWSWLGSWPGQGTLFETIQHHSLVTNTHRKLLSLSGMIFHHKDIDGPTRAILENLGLDFLELESPRGSIRFLEQNGVLKSPHDLCALLEAIKPCGEMMDTQGIRHLHAHFTSALVHRPQQLSPQHKAIVRSLHIFHIFPLNPHSVGVTREVGTLPAGKSLRFVSEASLKILRLKDGLLLPIVPEVAFVSPAFLDVDCVRLLTILDFGAGPILSELDIIALIIANFPHQPKPVKRAFLHLLVNHIDSVPPHILRDVQKTTFLPVSKGALLKSPQQVIDPECDLAALFSVDDDSLPHIADDSDVAIVASLRSLGLLRTHLSRDIVKDRIAFIASSSPAISRKISVRLLQVLNETRFDCSGLSDVFKASWIPTSNGSRSPQESRDVGRAHHQALFDRVWDVVDADVIKITSPSLRRALGWNCDIPLDVLKAQLHRELEAGDGPTMCERLNILLPEFGRRVSAIKGTSLEVELRRLTSQYPWVPVTPTIVAITSRALLDHPPPGFYLVPARLIADGPTTEFLRLMGCSERPSNNALLEELCRLPSPLRTGNDVNQVVRLLGAIDVNTLPMEDQLRILVPDRDGVLRGWSNIYYDDLGSRAYGIELPGDRWNAHRDITQSLATRLGIHTLSSLNLKACDVDDEDMGEDLTTRISNVLRQYSIEQAFNEFLANASDAGATQFNILVDEFTSDARNILSPEMRPLLTLPAIIIHNDAVFNDSDFRGIRRVGLGSKQGRVDTIGKFGLGALSMFHFTEVPMIVSGAYVQFLDPSRRFLPRDGTRARSALRVPISQLRQLNGDHLESLRGIRGFTPEMDYYNGTLFRLSLRDHHLAQQSQISRELVRVRDVEALVQSYKATAGPTCLFIHLKSTTTSTRDRIGRISLTWSTHISRESAPLGPKLTHEVVTFSVPSPRSSALLSKETWHVASYTGPISDLPDDYEPLLEKHKLRDISVAVAAHYPVTGSGSATQHRLYSKLPLPTLTSLPIHVDGSFILADDRRSIRFEEGGQLNLESQYNTWILRSLVPMVYLQLLSSWPKPEKTVQLWPGAHHSRDVLTRPVVEAFYERFAGSSDKFCVSTTGHQQSPQDAVFFGPLSKGVKHVLAAIEVQHLVSIPTRVWDRVRGSGVRQVDPSYVATLLKRESDAFKAGFASAKIGVHDIDDLLSFLLPETVGTNLIGLPLLPLADGSLGRLEHPSGTIRYTLPLLSTTNPWPLLPPHHFLSRDLSTGLLLSGKFNVTLLSGPSIVKLIANEFPPAESRRLSASEKSWLKNFWIKFSDLGITANDIDTLPVIPTTEEHLHISLKHCQSKNVLVLSHGHPVWLPRVLAQLGALVVEKSAAPASLYSRLPSQFLTLDGILEFLSTLQLPRSLSQQFRNVLTKADQDEFASYTRSRLNQLRVKRTIGTKKKRHVEYIVKHQDIARQLPIWEVSNLDGTQTLLAVSDPRFKMLPLPLTLSLVEPFLPSQASTCFVEHDSDLVQVLNVEPLSFQDLVASHLKLPNTLPVAHVPPFRDLFVTMVQKLPSYSKLQLHVPNSNLAMVDCSTLYAHSTQLFRTAFRASPELFIHQSLRAYESRLKLSGLHVVVDFDSFKKCAQVVHDNADGDGAVEVFEWYNNRLWMSTGATRWGELSRLRFIPRSDIRRSRRDPTFSPQDYARELPPIISPNEVLRVEHESIAWTQRAVFRHTPSTQLLLANPSLGVPSPTEVVEHLRCLVLIAKEHPFNSDVLSDLTETYRWLASHTTECRDSLKMRQGEKIFLNVDDPKGALSWEFSSANCLLFDGPDEGRWQRVRGFLLPFKHLLLAVGAKQIVRPSRPELQLSSTEQVVLQFRTSLNNQRRERMLTDVTLVSSDGDDFPAHRTILAASTEHFSTQFCGGWRESSTASVDVDVSSDVLEFVLGYIYAGSLPEVPLQDDLLELLEVSDLWNLPDLFARVENQLIGTITLGTVKDLKDTADKYQAKTLVKACEKFRNDNAHAL